MGLSTVAFLKDIYARAKAAGKFNMTQQPDMMEYTWFIVSSCIRIPRYVQFDPSR